MEAPLTLRPRKLLSAVACATAGAALAGCPPRDPSVTSATFAADAAPLCGPDGRPLPGNNRKIGCTIPEPAPKAAP